MRVGSVFTGIGGFDLAFEQAGAEIAWQVEIDKFCLKVLAKHFPKAKRYADVTRLNPTQLMPVDLLCGGFPCQDLSVAGQRKGLAGSRSSLFFEFIRIANALKPRWLLIENVPGLFSSQLGNDFGIVLSTLANIGYGLQWRTLDSQYFGVPQRRRRVFIVGRFGSYVPPEILFESESLQRHPIQGGKASGKVAYALRANASHSGDKGHGGVNTSLIAEPLRSHIPATGGNRGVEAGQRVVQPVAFAQNTRDEVRLIGGNGQIVGSLSAQPGMKQQTYIAGALTSRDYKGADNIYAEEGKLVTTIRTSHTKASGSNIKSDGTSFTLEAGSVDSVLVPTLNASGSGLDRPGGHQGAELGFYQSTQYGVRRLMPTECERLQAFPDGWTCTCESAPCTSISEKHCADGPRYKALGNAVTVSVVRWVANRLAKGR